MNLGGRPCAICKDIPVHLVTEWRGVNFDKPICPPCANKAVQRMMANKEIDNPFTGYTR